MFKLLKIHYRLLEYDKLLGKTLVLKLFLISNFCKIEFKKA